MADAEDQEAQQQQNIDLRQSLNDAYAAVKGTELNVAFETLTFEELLDQEIERIEGTSLSFRPNELERVAQVEAKGLAAIAAIRSLPESAFVTPDPEIDVNT